MVRPNAHRPPQLLALVDQGLERLPNGLLLRAELSRVVIVNLLEFFGAIRKVARVDANFLKSVRHHESHLGLEVDVGDEGDVVAVAEEGLPNLAARLGLLAPLYRDAHNLGARVHAAFDLFHSGGDVARVCECVCEG